MRLLIACEFSGTVRDAFIARGHDAVSCDLLPSNLPGPHIEGDVLPLLRERWDGMIAFPPCTYLCSSGLHWNTRRPKRALQTEEALIFVRTLMDAPIPRIAIENPVGCISSRIRKPDQIIHPFMFGHPESKATCLWLKNFPPLTPTKIMEPEYMVAANGEDYKDGSGKRYSPTHYCSNLSPRSTLQEVLFPDARTKQIARWANQTASGQNKLPPSKDRWAIRSLTYQGIADAMAAQWT
jgi:hypothetical protein